MRNLQVTNRFNVKHEDLKDAKLFCVDSQQEVVYFVTNRNQLLKVEPNCSQVVSSSLLNADGESIVSVAYLFSYESVCAASDTGQILLYSSITQQVESVGNIASEIKNMIWSPDQEVVVFVTRNLQNDTLLLMNRDFEAITEAELDSDEFGEVMPVTVGWGKKETQFHGSEGKEAAKKQISAVKSVSHFDDGFVRVSWRGDGQSFVTSAVTPLTRVRQLRVWSREGVLQYSSDYVDGLEHALCWQPSGSLVASSQRRHNKHEIVFFEKNCLRHGEFRLPFTHDKVKVKEVLWNADSTLLAIWLEDLPAKAEDFEANDAQISKTYLQVWLVNNYHWYLKQSFDCGDQESIVCVQWDPEKSNRLQVLYSTGMYSQFSFALQNCNSLGSNSDDDAVAVVVDGALILVTPFRKVVVPPPMSAHTFSLSEPINQVIMGPDSMSNDFMVVTFSNKLCFFRSSVAGGEASNVDVKMIGNVVGPGVMPHCPSALLQLSWPEDKRLSDSLFIHHWTWLNSETLLFVMTNDDNTNELGIARIKLEPNGSTVCIERKLQIEGEVFQISSSSNGNDVAIQLMDGSMMKYSNGCGDVCLWTVRDAVQLKLRQPSPIMRVITLDDRKHILALSDSYCLYFDGFMLSDKCTSFSFNGDFLIYTTYDHLIHCLSVNRLQAECGNLKNLSVLEEMRNVERGSRIVVAVPRDTKVVLQMPRGNLEAIHPRALILHAVKRNLDQTKYKEAVVIMRKHRVDMNLLFDHNPEHFLKNMRSFVEQIGDAALINLFLSSLREEDVTSSIYKTAYVLDGSVTKTANKEKCTKSKVDLICDTVRIEMENLDRDRYFLGILTAHVKKKEPELDCALLKIKQLRDSGSSGNVTKPETALRHLLYLVDVDQLYNVALGTYDFELVLMVAEKSQKDPKEFLPFLNELKRMETNYQRFTIDVHLNRYWKALESICKCGEERFDECLTFVKTHRLYTHALKCFHKDSKQWKAIVEAHASHLLEGNHLDEAGLMYLRVAQYKYALNAFKKSLNWKQAFCAAYKMNLDEGEMVELARHFAHQLKSNERFIEAASVLENYAKDPEEAIVALIEGHSLESAMLLMHRYGRMDIAESHLRPYLTNQSATVIGVIDKERADFDRLVERLAVVRENFRKRIELQDECEESVLPESDLFSDASTVTGISRQMTWTSGTGSRFTSRTSRNKKKLDRKKVSLKEGSQFEDVAILESLSCIIERIDRMKEDCGCLVRALFLNDFEKEAQDVQTRLDVFVRHIVSRKTVIWPAEEGHGSQAEIKLGPMSTANSAVAQMTQNAIVGRDIPHDYVRFLQPPTLSHSVKWKLENLKL